MKKITLCLMTACLSLSFFPNQSNALSVPASQSSSVEKLKESKEARVLLLRLNEIKDMDKSNMKSAEKKKLRVEVRSIKHQLSTLGGGVYISIGGLIIIILLLIILF